MKKVLKTVLIILVIAFIVIQFIRPAKNEGEEIAANQIIAIHQVPDTLQQILKASCNDCHTNTTYYPWIQKFSPWPGYLMTTL